MKSEEEIMLVPISSDDKAARFLYDHIYARDFRGIFRPWDTAVYQAPETREGFAVRLCSYVAKELVTAIAEGALK